MTLRKEIINHMKIKLTIPGGLFSQDRVLVINAANIESMVENDDDGTDIMMTDTTRHTVKETVAEIIAAYTPAPLPQPEPEKE